MAAPKKKQQEENANKVLQVYHNGTPMTQVEGAMMIARITLEMVQQHLIRTPWVDIQHVSSRCPKLDGANVGIGTCLVSKYLKYSYLGNYIDHHGCGTCKADKIMQELNHIFRCCFDGAYTVQWRPKRGHLLDDVKKPKGRTKKTNDAARVGIPEVEKKKPGRPKKTTPTPEPIVTEKPKRKPGRPKKVVDTTVEPKPKRKPGRPKKNAA